MMNLKNFVIAAAAITLGGFCGMGLTSHAAEESIVPEYGTIEDLGDGTWIGSDSLLPDESENIKNVDTSVDNKTTESVSTDDAVLNTTVSSSNETTTDIVEKSYMTLEMPSVDVVAQKPVVDYVVSSEDTTTTDTITDSVVDKTCSDDTTVSDTTKEEVSDSELSDVTDNETDTSKTTTDSTYVDEVVDNTNVSTGIDTLIDESFYVESFTQNDLYEDYDSDEPLVPSVKGDSIFKDSNFYEDYDPDEELIPEIKGDDIFPDISPEIPKVSVVTNTTEKVPQVLSDNLFTENHQPRTGDTSQLFGIILAFILSLALMIVMITRIYKINWYENS